MITVWARGREGHGEIARRIYARAAEQEGHTRLHLLPEEPATRTLPELRKTCTDGKSAVVCTTAAIREDGISPCGLMDKAPPS